MKCRFCGQILACYVTLLRHVADRHPEEVAPFDLGGKCLDTPIDGIRPTEAQLTTYPPNVRSTVRQSWLALSTIPTQRQGGNTVEYRVRLSPTTTTVERLRQLIRLAHAEQVGMYKLSLQIATLLTDTDGHMRVGWIGRNSTVQPLSGAVITCYEQLEDLLQGDLTESSLEAKQLPRWLVKHNGLVTFTRNQVRQRPYKDYKCAFRCVVLARSGCAKQLDVPEFEQQVDELFGEYMEVTGGSSGGFAGLQLADLPVLERLSGVRFNVYITFEERLKVNTDSVPAKRRRRTAADNPFIDGEAAEGGSDDDDGGSEIDFEHLAAAQGEWLLSEDEGEQRDETDEHSSDSEPEQPDPVPAATEDRRLARIREAIGPGGITADMLIHEGHCMLITSLQAFKQQLACTRCNQVFTAVYKFKDHVRRGTCSVKPRNRFIEHGYEPSTDLFETIAIELGQAVLVEGIDDRQHPSLYKPADNVVVISKSDQFPQEMIAFDIETAASSVDLTTASDLQSGSEEYVSAMRYVEGCEVTHNSISVQHVNTLADLTEHIEHITRCFRDYPVQLTCKLVCDVGDEGSVEIGPVTSASYITTEVKLSEYIHDLEVAVPIETNSIDRVVVEMNRLSCTRMLAEQVPYAIGIGANFALADNETGDNYHSIFDPDPQTLTNRFVDLLQRYAEEFQRLRLGRYNSVLNLLDAKIEEAREAAKRMKCPGQNQLGTDQFKEMREEVEQLIRLRYSGDVYGGQIETIEADIVQKLKTLKAEVITAAPIAARAGRLENLTALKQRLTKFCSTMPVIGFCSGRFDIGVLKPYLFPELIRRDLYDTNSSVIRKGTTYQLISCNGFAFYDIASYLPPGCSYAKFLHELKVAGEKGIFPHDLVTSYDELTRPRSFPSRDDFCSVLKGNTSVDEETYTAVAALWETNGWTCLKELAEYYLRKDVIPLVTAATLYANTWADHFGIALFGGGVVSVPGAALRILFDKKQRYSHFASLGAANSWLHQELMESICGGPSLVMHRYLKINETPLPNGGNTCRSIHGCDANSLYLWSIAQSMPAHLPVFIRPSTTKDDHSDEFARFCRAVHWSRAANDYTENDKELDADRFDIIRDQHLHARFTASEIHKYKRKEVLCCDAVHLQLVQDLQTRLAAVGIHKTTDQVRLPRMRHFMAGGQLFLNSVFGNRYYLDGAIGLSCFIEYDGCYYHQHSCMGKRSGPVIDSAERRIRRELTLLKHASLRAISSDVHIIAECDMRVWCCNIDLFPLNLARLQTQLSDPRSTFATVQDIHDPNGAVAKSLRARSLTGFKLEEGVRSGEVTGFVKVSLQIPHHDEAARKYCSVLPPIFKNYNVTRDLFSAEKQVWFEEAGLLKQPRRTLLASYYGRNLIMHTGYLQYLLNHPSMGVKITKIHWVLQYSNARPFKAVADSVWHGRAKAVADGHGILALVWKLLGNSFYGRTLTRVERFMNVRFCKESAVAYYTRQAGYRAAEYIGSGTWEVSRLKQTITYELPIQIGLAVYGHAKYGLLKFVYDFLDVYVRRCDYGLTTADTDSIYFALATSTIEQGMERRIAAEGCVHLRQQFHSPSHPFSYMNFIASRDHDDATGVMRPGKFKFEMTGAVAMVALMPKTNIYQMADTITKITAKGCNKAQNSEVLTFDNYMTCLQNVGKKIPVVNTGLRKQGVGMALVQQLRASLTSEIFKCDVLPDQVTCVWFVSDFGLTAEELASSAASSATAMDPVEWEEEVAMMNVMRQLQE